MKGYWNASLLKRFPSHEAALDRIAELEALRDESVALPGSVLGLSPLQTRMVGFIALRGRVSHNQLLGFVWGGGCAGREHLQSFESASFSGPPRSGATWHHDQDRVWHRPIHGRRERWRRAVAAARGEVAS